MQTECIIIMWDSSKYETFDNIPNFYSTIVKGMLDYKFRKAPIFIIENKIDLYRKNKKKNIIISYLKKYLY